MEAEFWMQRWEAGTIGWDQAVVHPSLVTRWHELAVPAGSSVFVPLCGKSIDMAWLAQQGHRVIGSELSEIGVRRFFDTVGLHASTRADRSHTVFTAGPYEIWCGDVFELPPSSVAGVVAAYDRASLVALTPDLRRRYAGHLANLLAPGTASMLVTFVYEQSEMAGPPFSVDDCEVSDLFADDFTVELMADDDVSSRYVELSARGVSSVREQVHVLRRRS